MPESFNFAAALTAPPQSPGEALQSQDGTAPQGAGGGNGTAAPPGGLGGGNIIWMLMLFFFVIIIWSMMGQRREKKKRDAMLSAIRKHDEVQTIGGIIGSVVDVKGNTVVLKVDEASNTRIRVARSAIQQVLSERQDTEAEQDKDKEAVSE